MLRTVPRSSLLLLAALGPALAQGSDPANQIHYPLAPPELAGALQGADQARTEGKLERAVELYRTVLDGDRSGNAQGYLIAPLPTPAQAGAPRRFQGLTQGAIDGLRALPPEGRALFRKRYDYRAQALRAQAMQAADPARELARVYELYPISSHAPAILEQMAELALERGQLQRAARYLERLIRDHGGELPDPLRVRQKQLVCAVGLGEVDQVRQLLDELRRDDPEGALHLSAVPVEADELVARAAAIRAARAGRGQAGSPSWSQPRGDSANRAVVETPFSLGEPLLRPRSFERPIAPRIPGGQGFLQPGAQTGMPARALPLIHGDSLLITTPDALLAYDLRTGEERPRAPRLRMGAEFADDNPKVQFGGVIDQGRLIAPFLEDVLLDQSYRGIPIKVQMPIRKLAGFDLERWRWSWVHARLLHDTEMAGWSFPAPPVSEDGVVYGSAFSIQGFVNCYVAAFDAGTGAPIWSSWIASGQVEQTMFGEQATEPLCTPVALVDGMVIHSTSFGCLAALEADTGRLCWITEYDQIEVRAPKGYYADPRTIAWENNAPLVERGVAVVAPLDSNFYYAYDLRSGERLWREKRSSAATNADLRFLMGAADGLVAVAGGHEVDCRDVRSGKLMWNTHLGGRQVSGRGAIAGGALIVPVQGEVLLIDMKTGKRGERYEVPVSGNVAVCGRSVALASGEGKVATLRKTAVAAPAPAERPGRDF